MKKSKRKSTVPGFITNRPLAGYFGMDFGKRDSAERQKNYENQKKLALRNKK